MGIYLTLCDLSTGKNNQRNFIHNFKCMPEKKKSSGLTGNKLVWWYKCGKLIILKYFNALLYSINNEFYDIAFPLF